MVLEQWTQELVQAKKGTNQMDSGDLNMHNKEKENSQTIKVIIDKITWEILNPLILGRMKIWDINSNNSKKKMKIQFNSPLTIDLII